MAALISRLRHQVFEREVIASAGARRWLAGTVLAVCTALGAFIVVPVPGTPVPITLQTFFVLAGAGLLGSRISTAGQAGYVLAGGLGLPLFAGGAFGAPILLGPTGGYLLGFVLASWLIGRLRDQARSWGRLLLVLAAADLVLLACGTLWLAAVLQVDLPRAAVLGLLPFLPGEALKIPAAAALILAWGRRARKLVAA